LHSAHPDILREKPIYPKQSQSVGMAWKCPRSPVGCEFSQ
jgi:hypothetical protein